MFIQALEARRLLSASFDPRTGALSVVGTDKPDTIAFTREDHGTPILILDFNGQATHFDAPRILSIHIDARAGADRILIGSTSIPAIIQGGRGNDLISGGSGNDKIFGDGGANVLFGGKGNDRITAGLQNDSIFGGKGDDTIIPDNTPTADDTISGGDGNDLVDYSASTIAVIADVGSTPKAASANDVINGDIEAIVGSQFNDTITNSSANGIEMFGNGGDDTITGGAGDDTIDGGGGHDSLVGGAGNDHFRAKDGETDTIDGGAGTNDVVDLSDKFFGLDTITNVP